MAAASRRHRTRELTGGEVTRLGQRSAIHPERPRPTCGILRLKDINVSERLTYLCDVRLEGGNEGFEEELAERPLAEIISILGEAVDALLDAESQHKREMQQLAERLKRES